jgi:hypothetical protein
MKEPTLKDFTDEEVLWFASFFHHAARTAPDSDYQPYVYGGHFAEEDCLEALRDEATNDGPEVLESVFAYAAKGRWPRLRKRVKFSLSLRLGWASSLCMDIARRRNVLQRAFQPKAPPEARQVIVELLSDYWDGIGASEWVEANKTCIDRPPNYSNEQEHWDELARREQLEEE